MAGPRQAGLVGKEVAALGVPAWVDTATAAAICSRAGIAVVLPAVRAGRPSAV